MVAADDQIPQKVTFGAIMNERCSSDFTKAGSTRQICDLVVGRQLTAVDARHKRHDEVFTRPSQTGTGDLK